MRYVLSGEASPAIGAGHVMRLSAIGEELISRGIDVAFVGSIVDVDWLKNRILTLGFSTVKFEERDFVSDPRSDILILDSYTKDPFDKFVEKSNWKKIVSISDKSTPLYRVDLVVHPNISENKIDHQGESFYSGPLYVPFRKSITKHNNHLQSKLKILLVGGGTDPFKFVENVARVLVHVELDFEARLFTNNQKKKNLDSRFVINEIGPEFDEFSNVADLVFTTSSTTSLEFVGRQIAMGIGCSIKNQEDYYNKLSNMGVAIPIGQVLSGRWKLNANSIKLLVADESLRSALRAKCKEFIDLKGATRIADLILDL